MLRVDTHGTTALIFLCSILCDKPGLHTLTSNVRAVPERQHLLPHAGESSRILESTSFKYNERSTSNDTGMNVISLAMMKPQEAT